MITFLFTAPYCTVVGDMLGIGLGCFGRHFNRPVNVLVTLLQKDRVREASVFLFFFFVRYTLIPVHRTDSSAMTLMSYTISTGLLTR
jgi:hypothetical protein